MQLVGLRVGEREGIPDGTADIGTVVFRRRELGGVSPAQKEQPEEVRLLARKADGLHAVALERRVHRKTALHVLPVDFPSFLHYGGADFLQRAEIGEHRARGGAENARKLLRGDGFEWGAAGNIHGGVDDLLTGKFGFRRHGRSFFLCVIIVTQRILHNNYNAITRRRQ